MGTVSVSGVHRLLLLGVAFALAGGVVAFAPHAFPLASTQAVFGVCRNSKCRGGANRLFSSVAEAPSAEPATEATTVNIRYVQII